MIEILWCLILTSILASQECADDISISNKQSSNTIRDWSCFSFSCFLDILFSDSCVQTDANACSKSFEKNCSYSWNQHSLVDRFSNVCFTSTQASSICNVGEKTYILSTANLLYIPRLWSSNSVFTNCDLPEPLLAVINSLNDSKLPNIQDLVGSKFVIYNAYKMFQSQMNPEYEKFKPTQQQLEIVMTNLQQVIDRDKKLDRDTLWRYINDITDNRAIIMLFMINTCDKWMLKDLVEDIEEQKHLIKKMSDYFVTIHPYDIRMNDICNQIKNVMVVPIPIFENPQFDKIWVDIFEYTVINDERKQMTDDFPYCLSALFE